MQHNKFYYICQGRKDKRVRYFKCEEWFCNGSMKIDDDGNYTEIHAHCHPPIFNPLREFQKGIKRRIINEDYNTLMQIYLNEAEINPDGARLYPWQSAESAMKKRRKNYRAAVRRAERLNNSIDNNIKEELIITDFENDFNPNDDTIKDDSISDNNFNEEINDESTYEETVKNENFNVELINNECVSEDTINGEYFIEETINEEIIDNDIISEENTIIIEEIPYNGITFIE